MFSRKISSIAHGKKREREKKAGEEKPQERNYLSFLFSLFLSLSLSLQEEDPDVFRLLDCAQNGDLNGITCLLDHVLLSLFSLSLRKLSVLLIFFFYLDQQVKLLETILSFYKETERHVGRWASQRRTHAQRMTEDLLETSSVVCLLSLFFFLLYNIFSFLFWEIFNFFSLSICEFLNTSTLVRTKEGVSEIC